MGHFKQSLKALSADDSVGDLQTKLQRFLFSHRATPTSMGKSPSEMLMQRQMRTRFDNLKPSETKQNLKVYEQNLDNAPLFAVGQPVYTLNFGKYGEKWVSGVITAVHSPMNYQVQVDEASWKRHRNQLRPRTLPESLKPVTDPVSIPLPAPTAIVSTPSSEASQPVLEDIADRPNDSLTSVTSPEVAEPVPLQERPKRHVRPPARYRDLN